MPVRWNSTFDFLDKALKMKESIKKLMRDDDDLSVYSIDKDGWSKIEKVASFLQV